MTTYKNLDAWTKSMELVKSIYKEAKHFPKEEMYGLTSQIKRAAVSVPSNIAEGCGRNYKKETIQFMHISRGSLYELDTLITIASEVEIINKDVYKSILMQNDECIRITNGLINYFERSNLK